MILNDPWDLLRSGARKEGLGIMRQAFAREPSKYSMDFGIGNLFAGEYGTAWQHFTELKEKTPTPTAIDAGMAGVAKWCSNEPVEAVAEWRAGLQFEFTDWAGGVKLPLLLFTASAIKRRELPELRAESEKLLMKRVESHLIKNWPGPLAEFILGRIDEGSLRQKCKSVDNDDTAVNLWLANFYVGVRALARGNVDLWAETIRKTADTSQPEWSNHDFFLGCIWNEEFFLARHEAAHLFARRAAK